MKTTHYPYTIRSHSVTIIPMAPFTPKSTSKLRSALHFKSKSKKRVKMICFDKENHDIEETNTETFMCRSMSATNAYTEL